MLAESGFGLTPAAADRIVLATFNEVGYKCVVGKGQHEIGDVVFFIPPEAVLPTEMAEELDVAKYLRKGRVCTVRLKGVYSEGLIIDQRPEDLEAILKWETPPRDVKGGSVFPSMPEELVPMGFDKFYDIPNLQNDPSLLREGEPVWISEKAHGTNARCGWHLRPDTCEPWFYIGTHSKVLDNRPEGIDEAKRHARHHVEVLEWARDQLLSYFKVEHLLGVTFYGEIYGPGIQHLHYGANEPELAVFAAQRDGEWYIGKGDLHDLLCPDDCLEKTGSSLIDWPPFESARYGGLAWALEKAEGLNRRGESALAEDNGDRNIQEGIVITSVLNPNRMVKVINPAYLTTKGRTERH